MTSSIRRPVSADVITDGTGSVSPGRRSTGTPYHRQLRDNTTATPSRSRLRPHEEVTSRPPCVHVTSVATQLHPVVDDEDAIQSSGISSPGHCPITSITSSSSRPLSDVTSYLEVSLPSTSFPRLDHVTGSDFASTLRAFAAALQGRSANIPPRAISPDTVLPLFRAPPRWPQPDLRRRITLEDAAQMTTCRPKRSTDLQVDDVRVQQTPVLPLFWGTPTWPRGFLQRRTPAEQLHLMTREPLRSAEPGIKDGRLPADDVLFFDTHNTRTLPHVGRLDASPAMSIWSSLLASQPRNLFPHPPPHASTDLLHRHYHHHHHTYAGGQQFLVINFNVHYNSNLCCC